MMEYGINILFTVALVSLGMLLCYREGDKAVRLALSLVLMSAVLLPLSSLIGKINFDSPEAPSQAIVYENAEYLLVAEGAFCEGVELMIADRFSLEVGNIKVRVRGFDFEALCCESMTVTLTGRASFADSMAIKSYTEENIKGCEVKVEVG